MLLKMFTVYDSKAETYLRPFSMESTGVAIRGFNTTLNDSQSEMAKYPGDFTLMELAEFDTETGAITVYSHQKNLGNGLHIQKLHNPDNTQNA